MYKKILVPLDINEGSSWRKALPVAIGYARQCGAELHVMTVVPDDLMRMTVVAQLIPGDYEKKLVEDASARLSALLKQEAPGDLQIQQTIRRGGIYKEILHHAGDIGADLIVMSAHRPDMRDYLLGPNAAQIVRHADCSVWVVRE